MQLLLYPFCKTACEPTRALHVDLCIYAYIVILHIICASRRGNYNIRGTQVYLCVHEFVLVERTMSSAGPLVLL